MIVLIGLVLVPWPWCPKQSDDPPVVREPQSSIEQREPTFLTARGDALDGDRAAEGHAVFLEGWEDLRINVYANALYRRDDSLVLNAKGDEVSDSVRVRRVDIDFRAPLGHGADAVVIASMVADPINDFDGELEEAFFRVRGFEESAWPVEFKAGKFRATLGRNNRWRLFELPQPTRPLAVTEFLGEDGFVQTGGSLSVGIPLGSDSHDLVATVEIVGSEDIALSGKPADQTDAQILNFDWTWKASPALAVTAGVSQYRGRSGDELLSGADVLFSWRWSDARLVRAVHLGAEAFLANPDGRSGNNPRGAYAWTQLQFEEDWFAGLRFDYLERLANPDLEVRQAGVYVSWFFSDRLRLGIGYEHSEGDESSIDGANHMYLEANFFLGPDPLFGFWSGR